MTIETAFGFSNEAMESLASKGAFLSTSGQKDNAMTISWGSIGMMWQKPVFTVPVRLSRFTLEQMAIGKPFGVSIPKLGEMSKELAICGSKSGRDMDKFSETLVQRKQGKAIDVPLVAGCRYYFECIASARYETSFFALNEADVERWYPASPFRDPHVLFMSEILEAYIID